MIIKETQNDKLTPFRDLEIGAIFKSGDRCYIKIEPIRDDMPDGGIYSTTRYNATTLENGRVVYFSDNTMMKPKPHAVLLIDGE